MPGEGVPFPGGVYGDRVHSGYSEWRCDGAKTEEGREKFEKCVVKSHFIAEVSKRVGWARLWDTFLSLGWSTLLDSSS